MSRPYRLQAEHCLYHITSRGNERKNIFRREGDYLKFLGYVNKAKERYLFYVYAYVLMTNHYHLLLETRRANLSRIMQYINSSYTTYHNLRNKRSGHLFQGRYKSIVVEKQRYCLELSRYIHLNPVRAGMVKKPEEYRWSSYQGFLSRRDDEYIDQRKAFEIMSIGRKAYREFVEEGLDKKINLFKEVYGGFWLGSPSFIKASLSELRDQVEGCHELSYKGAFRRQIATEQIICKIEEVYGKKIDEIIKSKKRPMKEKKVLIYLLRRLTELTNQEIGEVVGMSYFAVSMAGMSMDEEIKRDKRMKKEIENIVFSFEV